MMMMDEPDQSSAIALDSYLKLVSKLNEKKYFGTKKINYDEMIDQFNKLMDQFNNFGNLRYAAFCCLSVARCERALQNTQSEALGYTNSGHAFYMAELERAAANEPCFEEYVGEATNCYLTAINLYISKEMKATAASLYHELGTLLQKLGRNGEAASFFIKAAEMHQALNQFHTAMASLWLAVDSSIFQCDYITSCVTLNWIIKLASEVPDMNDSIEVSTRIDIKPVRVGKGLKGDSVTEAILTLILLLVLQGDYQQSKDYICKLSESSFSINDNEEEEEDEKEGEDGEEEEDDEEREDEMICKKASCEFISLLTDFVTSCETSDIGGMKWCQRELWQTITPRQNELFHRIIQAKSH